MGHLEPARQDGPPPLDYQAAPPIDPDDRADQQTTFAAMMTGVIAWVGLASCALVTRPVAWYLFPGSVCAAAVGSILTILAFLGRRLRCHAWFAAGLIGIYWLVLLAVVLMRVTNALGDTDWLAFPF